MPSTTKSNLFTEKTTRHGTLRFFTHDDPIGRALMEYGEWAENEISFLLTLIRPGDVVLDVGANVGTHSVAFARKVGPAGRVYSFEPQKEVFDVLKYNIAQNGLETCATPLQVCVGDSLSKVLFPVLNYENHSNFGSVHSVKSTDNNGLTYLVDQVSLDSLNLEKCRFIKVDAEGFEIPVLKGATRLISTLRPDVYAECNTIENGIELIDYFKDSGYQTFFHRVAAFNRNNFLNNKENFFGAAHESSLLFVHNENLHKLDTSAVGLVAINNTQSFVEEFIKTTRFGDLAKENYEFKTSYEAKPVIVIVPVYNAYDDLQVLLSSLLRAVPRPVPGLKFIFSNDASTDPRIQELFNGAWFFKRTDTSVRQNEKNLGFVKNMNAAFACAAEADLKSDFIILNSDTRVTPGFIEALQATAFSDESIGSVTPLTNNGTIASLFNWPNGGELPASVSFAEVSRAVSKQKIDMWNIDVPTGIGFCMYIKRTAANEVGYFDELFGIGYGEECDWCMRAAALGYRNVISTATFIYHSGGKSFGNETKTQRILDNGKKLLAKHPTYEMRVGQHLVKDPLKFLRLNVILSVLQVKQTLAGRYLFTLHTDPDAIFNGGTEAHVRQLRQLLLNDGAVVFVLAPNGSDTFVLRVNLGQDVIFESTFNKEIVPNLIEFISPYISHLHVHHTLNWSEEQLRSLANSEISHKTLTAHDFWLLCPSINLLSGPKRVRFCAVEDNLLDCNTCLRQNWDYKDGSIQSYRARSIKFLSKFDRVLVPSPSSLSYFRKAFGSHWSVLEKKFAVLSHDLSYMHRTLENVGVSQSILDSQKVLEKRDRICFIGGIGDHKGSQVLLEAVPRLNKEGFEVEIFGSINQVNHKNISLVKITPYSSVDELSALIHKDGLPSLFGYISIWAETFCYTFYEGLLIAPDVIPVVGPFGNPAQICKENGLGPVMTDCTADALVKAALEARANKANFTKAIQSYRNEISKYLDGKAYIESYQVKLALKFVGFSCLGGEGRSKEIKLLAQIESVLRDKDDIVSTTRSTLYQKVFKINAIMARSRPLKLLVNAVFGMIWVVAKRLNSVRKRIKSG